MKVKKRIPFNREVFRMNDPVWGHVEAGWGVPVVNHTFFRALCIFQKFHTNKKKCLSKQSQRNKQAWAWAQRPGLPEHKYPLIWGANRGWKWEVQPLHSDWATVYRVSSLHRAGHPGKRTSNILFSGQPRRGIYGLWRGNLITPTAILMETVSPVDF